MGSHVTQWFSPAPALQFFPWAPRPPPDKCHDGPRGRGRWLQCSRDTAEPSYFLHDSGLLPCCHGRLARSTPQRKDQVRFRTRAPYDSSLPTPIPKGCHPSYMLKGDRQFLPGGMVSEPTWVGRLQCCSASQPRNFLKRLTAFLLFI